jgi:hypothetical protein
MSQKCRRQYRTKLTGVFLQRKKVDHVVMNQALTIPLARRVTHIVLLISEVQVISAIGIGVEWDQSEIFDVDANNGKWLVAIRLAECYVTDTTISETDRVLIW